MKKYSSIFLILFTIVSFSQTKTHYNIGILLDNKTPKLDPLLTTLQNEIKAVIGEDAIISFPKENILVNGYDLENAKANYNTLLSNNTDIIIAFGILNNVVISTQTSYPKPTILFGAISNDFGYIKENNQTSETKNFTYIIASQSYKKDITALKKLSNYNHVGIAVEQKILDVLPFKEIFDKETKELGVTYKIIPFKSANDIINEINNDIDAFYLTGGFFLSNDEMEQIVSKLIEEKIPSFTNTSVKDVELGIMATNRPDDNFNQFFRRIALNVEAYINGEDLGGLPVYFQSDDNLTVNYNTAKNVGIPIKYSLIANTNFIGDFKKSSSEKKYNLLEVMHGVVDKNLSLVSSRKDIVLSEQDIKTAKSNYYPDVSASTTGAYIDPNLAEISNGKAPEYSTFGAITLSQVVFSESANANIGIQKNLHKAEKENYKADELDAIFNASNAYFNALILKANLQIRKQNLDLTKRNLQIAKQNFEAGQEGKADVLRLRSEMAQNSQSFVEAANSLKQVYFSLNQLLNNPINYKIDVDETELGEGLFKTYDYERLRDLIDDPKLVESLVEYLIIKAKENAPELKSLDYNLLATKRNVKLNGSGRFLPTLAVQAAYNRYFSQWGKGATPKSPLNDDYNLGLNLSIPIFQQNQKNINRQTALIQQDKLNINIENVELNIEANINNAILNLVNEIAIIETSKVSETAAKESLELIQTAYSSGAVTITELIDSQNNYLSAQLTKASATYNYLLSTLQLERYIGFYFLLNTSEENQQFIQDFYNYVQNKN